MPGYRQMASSSSSLDLRKVLLVWRQDANMDAMIIELKHRLVTELRQRRIQVTEDEDDVESQMVIIFLTKQLLIDRCLELRNLVNNRFSGRCATIICEDRDDEKFLELMLCHVDTQSGFDYGKWGHLYHGVGIDAVHATVLTITVYAIPEYCLVRSSSTAGEIIQTAETIAEDAASNPYIFNPTNLDYNKLGDISDSHLLHIYKKLLLNDLASIPQGSGDFLFSVFVAGCQCPSSRCCLDATTVFKFMGNLNVLHPPAPNQYYRYGLIPKETHNLFIDDPLSLHKGFMHAMHTDRSAFPLYLHFARGKYKSKYFIIVEDFDVSNPLALEQLTNLSYMLGTGSLVIITSSASSVSTPLLDEANVVACVPGTSCCKMLKSYKFLKSKYIQPMPQELFKAACRQVPNMLFVEADFRAIQLEVAAQEKLQVYAAESPYKKLKTNSF